MKIILPILLLLAEQDIQLLLLLLGQAPFIEGYAVWIDYQNGVFTDAGDKFGLKQLQP
jgi:hypothetical protein